MMTSLNPTQIVDFEGTRTSCTSSVPDRVVWLAENEMAGFRLKPHYPTTQPAKPAEEKLTRAETVPVPTSTDGSPRSIECQAHLRGVAGM